MGKSSGLSCITVTAGSTQILESANMHSFIQLVFECLLCARHCPRHWGIKGE